MTPESILENPAKVLSDRDRISYFDKGYLLAERYIGGDWLSRLREATDKLIEQSRPYTESDAVFDLETGHTSDDPRLRRVSSPCDVDREFWTFLNDSPIGDLFEDLLGPDVKFYQSKLNFKWARGGTEVKWHQDAPFFPHTNDSVMTVGLYLEDCGLEQGPLAVIPGSHKGEIFSHYDSAGRWTGSIQNEDLPRIDTESAELLSGPAGSITVHNYRTVHGSGPNTSPVGRPLLLNVVSAADAMPYTHNALASAYEQEIIRGKPAKWAHHTGGQYQIPPDWSGGYSSIFAIQQG
ncbi:MAG: phytanoyl-CoA dioxygenase family protein [Alphaproteobacteria bacterium]